MKLCEVLGNILDAHSEGQNCIASSLITLANHLVQSLGSFWFMQVTQFLNFWLSSVGIEYFSEGMWLGKISSVLYHFSIILFILNTQDSSTEGQRFHIPRPWVRVVHSFMFWWYWGREAIHAFSILSLDATQAFFFPPLRNNNLLPYLSSINLLTSRLFPLVSRGILATCIICSPHPAECFIFYKDPGIWFITSSPCLVLTNFRGYLSVYVVSLGST